MTVKMFRFKFFEVVSGNKSSWYTLGVKSKKNGG
jgi:hypothetical protein